MIRILLNHDRNRGKGKKYLLDKIFRKYKTYMIKI